MKVDQRMRCPECESACEVIAENVWYQKTPGWTLYRCSNIDCWQVLIRQGTTATKLNQDEVMALSAENLEQSIEEVNREITRCRGQLNRVDQIRQVVKKRIDRAKWKLIQINVNSLYSKLYH